METSTYAIIDHCLHQLRFETIASRGCSMTMGAVASAGQDGRSRRGTTIVERPAAPATSHHDYYHHYDTVTTTIIAIIDENGQPPSSRLSSSSSSSSSFSSFHLLHLPDLWHHQPVQHDSGYGFTYA
ncbi:hypothetical protein V1478_008262 [Vespula squamosa]|uniref:Uncharacterized protein n=1 Tax=Vespula squamosa TaxID=30214 RepID=A0ABD2AYA8_VESSQ